MIRFSGNELWQQVPKQEFIIKPRRGWGGGSLTQRQFIEISKKMDFHNYVNKEITLLRSNDTMMYARGKHTQFNNDRRVHPKIWNRQHEQCLNDDSISNRLRMKQPTINFKAIGLLEVQESHIIVRLSVFQLEITRGPRNERRWQTYYYIKNS